MNSTKGTENIIYRNLAAVMVRNGVTRKDLAQVLGCTVGTVGQKLTGKTDFNFAEAKKIKRYLGVDMPIDVLFDVDVETSQGNAHT